MGTFFISLACSGVAFTIGIGVGGLFTVLRIDRHDAEMASESEAQ